MAGTIDGLPTIAAIVGAELPGHPIDGLDLSALLADPRAPSPHRKVGFIYDRNGRVKATRRGEWKLRLSSKEPELYDVEKDIGESSNVADFHPDVVRELQALIASDDADLRANSRPGWRSPGG